MNSGRNLNGILRKTLARSALVRTTKVLALEMKCGCIASRWHDAEEAVVIQILGLKWYSKVNNTCLHLLYTKLMVDLGLNQSRVHLQRNIDRVQNGGDA